MPLHILIIEPDASVAQITHAGIARCVPEATLAIEPDPERGWLSIKRCCPDILIIDPPVQSLVTDLLIHELKRDRPEAQVIVLASAPTPSLRRHLQHLGADAFLAKPAPIVTLLDLVQQAIETIQLRCGHETTGTQSA